MKSRAVDDAEASERRWAAAEKLATGDEDDGAIRESRRRSRRGTWIKAAIIIVVGVSAEIVAIRVFPHHQSPTESSEQLYPVSLILPLAGMVLLFGGVIWSWRTKRFVVRWRSVAGPLSRAQRRLAVKMIHGTVPVDYSKLVVVRAIADQNRRITSGAMVPYIGLMMVEVSVAFELAWEILYVGVGGALLFAVIFGVTLREYLFARAFLKRYPAPSAEAR